MTRRRVRTVAVDVVAATATGIEVGRVLRTRRNGRLGEPSLPCTNFARRHARQIFNRPMGLVPF